MERFAAECGLRGPLRFLVDNVETGRTEKIDVPGPFVLIGQARGCDLRLAHPEVCYRHAYLQVIQGRLYGFDLDSEHGTSWGRSVRREGVVTFETNLQIGPYSIRLSRAPAFTQGLEPSSEDWELENEPLENTRLWFENAGGRSSHSPLRPVRRQITLLGRSGRSHLKLSDASVSKAHCSIVHTDFGFWVVDLLGRNGTKLKDRPIRVARLTPDESLSVGRFRMRLKDLTRDEAVFHEDPPVIETQRAGQDRREVLGAQSNEPEGSVPAEEGWSRAEAGLPPGELIRAQQALKRQVPAPPKAPLLNPDVKGGVSETLLLAMMNQFSEMQQQLLSHTQQQMTMLAELFGTLHKGQHDAVLEQLSSIQAITAELGRLRTQPAPPQIAPAPEAAADTEVRVTAAAPRAEVSINETAGTEPETDTDGGAPAVESRTQPPADSEVHQPGSSPSTDTTPPAAEEPVAGDATQEVPIHRAGRETRHGVSTHTWVSQRISELERERSSRWKRLFQLVGGGGPSSGHHR